MTGSRDSELAVVVEDSKVVRSKMAGKPFEAKYFAHTLRKNVFKTIFGFTKDAEVLDPLDPDLWEIMQKRIKVG